MSEKNRIKFLGTSAGWPLPRINCSCKICTSNNNKDKRLRPSILVNDRILIDAPPDLYHQIQIHSVDVQKIDYLLITHTHDDHIMGLFDLSKTYDKKNKITLVSSSNILNELSKKMRVSLFSFNTLAAKPFEKINLGMNTFLWMLPVQHTVETYGMKIKAPKPIFYAPEFRRIKPSSQKQLGDIDLAIIDGSSKSKKGQSKGHETIEEGIRLGKKINAKKILFTNIGHATDTHTELSSFVASKGGDKFNIAFDGFDFKV